MTAYYPSTVFVEDGPPDLVEYAAAKAAGEVAASRWAASKKTATSSSTVYPDSPPTRRRPAALELDDPVPLLLAAIRRTVQAGRLLHRAPIGIVIRVAVDTQWPTPDDLRRTMDDAIASGDEPIARTSLARLWHEHGGPTQAGFVLGRSANSRPPVQATGGRVAIVHRRAAGADRPRRCRGRRTST